MFSYGQYCPIAMATEILGDRWTLLIVRDLLTGVSHFNDLQRGLPGISRGLLSARLKRLVEAGIRFTRSDGGRGHKTLYALTPAGQDLQEVINALLVWGSRYAFADPRENQLDPLLLLWWMRDRVYRDRLPQARVVIQFCFDERPRETYWLLLTADDSSICLTHPGFDVDLWVTGSLAAFLQVWLGKLDYPEALAPDGIQVQGLPALERAFPNWFAWSLAAPVVRACRVDRDSML